MNLKPLFEMQEKLDNRIVKEHGLEGKDLLDKKTLALQVELGELANEWRGFKFWSNDQEPRTYEANPEDICEKCNGDPISHDANKITGQCDHCDGVGVYFHNPLLEEYVDCLHFILSIGIDSGCTNVDSFGISKADSVNAIDLFNYMFELVSDTGLNIGRYIDIGNTFMTLGYTIGLTEQQIYDAYMDKNATNHTRQDTGY